MDLKKPVFWGDQIAEKVIAERVREKYTVASGITPSGTIHIGNLREEMTASIVARALEDMGVKVRYIHSWDDFDRLRKIPGNLPENVREEFKSFIGMPVSKVPDPFGCHGSYGSHFEKEFEDSASGVGIKPEYIYQHKKYMNCDYAEQIKTALQMMEKIKSILSKFKTAENESNGDYCPCEIYCENCWKDFTKIVSYDGGYMVVYKCSGCSNESEFDFRKVGVIKLKWRVDWPMRWAYEKVDFEPGGKEHSTPGGSRTTAEIIAREIYGYSPPIYQMYDFVLGTGGRGKMSGSVGNIVSPKQMLQVYIPQVFRYFYVATKPIKEFAIPFDEGVNKVYEDFYRCERIYFGSEKVESDIKEMHWKRVYEFCCVGAVPKKQPIQVSFSKFLQLSEFFDFGKSMEKLVESGLKKSDIKSSEKRLRLIFEAAKNWRAINLDSAKKNESLKYSEEDKEALRALLEALEENYAGGELSLALLNLSKKTSDPKKFFRVVYTALIGKPYGPRLAELIETLGLDEVKKRLRNALRN